MTRLLRKSRRLLVPVMVLALFAAACSSDGDATPVAVPAAATATGATGATGATASVSTFPLEITDSSDTVVVFSSAPQRIISYSPAATEVLFAIGAGDRLVATDRFSNFPAAVLDLPKLEYSSPDPEAALAREPDLVLMVTQQRDSIEQFRGLGMTVLFLKEADSIDGVLDYVLLLGRITGNEQRATAVAAEMRTRIEAVRDALSDVDEGPTVFFELTADLYTAGPNTFIGGMIEVLKGRNVAEGTAGDFPQLSAESVIKADPEVILLADGEFGEDAETVGGRPGWSGISAVVNGRIYAINSDLTSRPGPRIVEGLEAMAHALYPDRFE